MNDDILKIAIVTRQMITGGVEKALIAMLKQFNFAEISVDLYVQNAGGELLQDLPDAISIDVLKSPQIKDFFKYPGSTIEKVLSMIQLKLGKKTYLEQNVLTSKMLFQIKKEYDIAIAYHAPNTVPVFFVINKLKAQKKVLWLHGDLETNGGTAESALKYYRKYDQIFAVSQNVYQSFVNNCPDMKERTKLFYNFVDFDGIKKNAEIGPVYQDEFNGTRILTIGRLNEQKGIDIAIKVCKKLVKNGYDIRWYVCGDGDDRQKLEDMIQQANLSNQFFLLGTQSNPFGYLNKCDLYVQPSRYEGYCTTTNEARMLGKPVVTTDVSGSREQFINQKTGWITQIDEQALYEQITWCIDHPAEMKQVQNNLQEMIRSDIDRKNHPLDELLYIGRKL